MPVATPGQLRLTEGAAGALERAVLVCGLLGPVIGGLAIGAGTAPTPIGAGDAIIGGAGTDRGGGTAGNPPRSWRVARKRGDEMRAGFRERETARREGVAVEEKSGKCEGVDKIARR